jgi:hypothetical protein
MREGFASARRGPVLAAFTVMLLALVPAAWAQGVGSTGTISGTVLDESGQTLPGANVTVTNEATHAARSVTTNDAGAFRFPALLPGNYTVRAELTGFTSFERKNTVLSPSGQVTLGDLRLKVGQMTETVTVEASGAKVEVENSDHSGVLTANQLAHIQTKGRDVTSLLKLIPGVSYRNEPQAMGDSFGSSMPVINGQPADWNNYTVDGLNGNELSGTSRVASAVSLDAISEVKVLLNTYKAEYGRSAGANVQVVTKSGSSDYHGSGYWYGRRTNWNANTWDANKAGLDRPKYHFDTYGASLGGPAPFQGADKKLFFFYSLEVLRVQNPGPVRFYSLPTERERNGDFSQSGVVIRDPLTGQPFPGNIIPANRINRSIQNLFNLYPLPNTDPKSNSAAGNFVRQTTPENPRMANLLRLDWKPTTNDSVFLTARTFTSDQYGTEITAAPSRWGYIDGAYLFDDMSANVGWTKIFNSNTINEFSVGARRQGEGFQTKTDADAARLRRAEVGFTQTLLFPELNTEDTIPRLLFGGKDNGGRAASDFTYDTRLGETAHDLIASVRDNFTWLRGSHAFKGGFELQRMHNNEARGGDFRGVLQFEHSTANSLSTGDDYANALLGVFNSFTQASAQRNTANRAWIAEWYLQDSWKATRRLNLDYGVRFLYYTPYSEADKSSASFDPTLYDPAKAPRLYAPVIVNGQRVAQDPANKNDIRPANFIGSLVPNSGDFANGNVAEGTPGYPSGFRDNQGIHPEPRLGFAYDLTGNGKTRLHGSVGLFHQGVLGGGTQGNLGSNPPIMRTVQFTNGLLTDLQSLEGRQPIGVVELRGLDRHAKTPSAYNWSLGVEREVGFSTVVDLTYVGSVGRHLPVDVDYNRLADGAQFVDVSPRNVDPTRPGQPLPDNFLRPFIGYGRIRIMENWATTNYNAMQVQINRRYAKGLQFGVAYTYSRAHGLDDNDNNEVPADRNRPASFYYGPSEASQTHNLIFNFTVDVPKLSKVWDNGFVRAAFDGWQFSGTYAWVSGNWQNFGTAAENLSQNNYNPDGTDSEDRPTLVGNPVPSNPSQTDGWVNPDAFAKTPRGSYGDVARNIIRMPPVNNLDLAAFKNFNLGHDLGLQFRLEAYNALNHTQIDTLNLALNFDAAGQLTAASRANFGKATGARDPRRLQASVRFTF